MSSLTIKQLDTRVLRALRQQAARKQVSLNKLVKDELARVVGLTVSQEVHDDLDHLAGTWSDGQAREFQEATDVLGHVDEHLWR